MKTLNKIVVILLNVLFCAVLLCFFTRCAFLRPFLGSLTKEFLSGLFLLVTLYANYYILYPKLYRSHASIYWSSVIIASLVITFLEFAIGYSFILKYNAVQIREYGLFSFFRIHLFMVFGRNLAFNLFPFVLRERKQLQKSLDTEVRAVYQYVRMLDVIDNDSNIRLVNINDIFYCRQQRNYTDIYMVQNMKYTRLGSMKHLEQLFGDDFIRITNTVLVPFWRIKECNGDVVVMKKVLGESEPTVFMLEPKTKEEVARRVEEGLQRHGAVANGKSISKRQTRRKSKRKQTIPSDEKLDVVLSYIAQHPNCNAKEIVAKTKISHSTLERCISELKKQGLIQYTGSKKTGGYQVANSPTEKS